MSLIPGGTGTTTKAVDGIEGATTGAPVSFPSGFQGGQVPSQLADANATLTAASNSAQVMTPTANRTITLPSSGVVTNYPFTIINLSPTFTITVLASGGQTITTLAQGTVTVAASQNAPTLAAQWIQLSNLASQTLLNKQISSTGSLTGALTLPAGSAAQRPTPVAGMTRLNTDSNSFEGYANGIWSSIGGGLNNQPVTNYLKTYAEANVAPGTLSTLASAAANLVSLTSFYADATSGSAALSSSTDSTLRGTANYLSAVSGSDSAGARFFQFPAFAIEGTDLGKPISIFADVSGVTTDGNWDVVVVRYNSTGIYQSIISVAGNASGATPASAKLPTGVAPFNGFFIPDSTTATDLYAIRYRSLANAVQIRLDSLMAGNQPVRVGAAVTDWQSYTPVTQGLGTISASDIFWRRIGDTLELDVRYTTGTPSAVEAQFGLPTGLTIDSSITTRGVGTWIRNNPTVTDNKQGVVLATGGTAFVRFSRSEYAVAGAPFTPLNGNTIFGGTEVQSFFARVKVSNWSSNVTMADRSVEEYGWNSDTSDTATTASGFSNGASGVQFGSFTAARAKRVRFQTPIQATDRIDLEVLQNGVWQPIYSKGYGDTLVQQYEVQVGVSYGASFLAVSGSSTDVDVFFGTYRLRVGGSGYGAVGAAWSGATGSIYGWRLRKVSSGAQIGGAISTSNIVGRVDGSVVGSGYIGEMIGTLRSVTGGFTYSTTSTTTVTTSLSNVLSATVNKGIYLVSFKIRSQTGSATALYANLRVGASQLNVQDFSTSTNSVSDAGLSGCIPFVITADGTGINISAQVGAGTTSGNFHELWIVRIA